MALRSIDSVDVQIWAGPNALAGGMSYDGLQMADYRGVTWGVMTQNNGGDKANQGKIWAVSLTEDKKWTTNSWVQVKGEKWEGFATGRVSVVVHHDWFYIVWRGQADNKVWLTSTEDFRTFAPVRAINDSFTTSQSPAVTSFRGYLILNAVSGASDPKTVNKIHWIWLTYPKYAETNWNLLNSDVTTKKGLSMTVHRNELYLFHTSADSGSFGYWKYNNDGFTSLLTHKSSIISAPSSVSFRDNGLYVTYRGSDGNIKWNRTFDGKSWQCTNGVNWRFALGDLGLVSFNTRLHLSYAEGSCVLSEPPKELEWVDMPEEKVEAPRWDSDSEDELEAAKMPCPVESGKRRSWWRRLLCFT